MCNYIFNLFHLLPITSIQYPLYSYADNVILLIFVTKHKMAKTLKWHSFALRKRVISCFEIFTGEIDISNGWNWNGIDLPIPIHFEWWFFYSNYNSRIELELNIQFQFLLELTTDLEMSNYRLVCSLAPVPLSMWSQE